MSKDNEKNVSRKISHLTSFACISAGICASAGGLAVSFGLDHLPFLAAVSTMVSVATGFLAKFSWDRAAITELVETMRPSSLSVSLRWDKAATTELTEALRPSDAGTSLSSLDPKRSPK